jgi:hypothetical protein
MATGFVWFGYYDQSNVKEQMKKATSKDKKESAHATEVVTLFARHGSIGFKTLVPPNPVESRNVGRGFLQSVQSYTPQSKGNIYNCLVSKVFDTEDDADKFMTDDLGLAKIFKKECLVYSKLMVIIKD